MAKGVGTVPGRPAVSGDGTTTASYNLDCGHRVGHVERCSPDPLSRSLRSHARISRISSERWRASTTERPGVSRLEHVRLGGGERQPEEVLHLRRVHIGPTAQHRGLHDGEVLAQRSRYDLRTGHHLHRRRQYGHPEPGAHSEWWKLHHPDVGAPGAHVLDHAVGSVLHEVEQEPPGRPLDASERTEAWTRIAFDIVLAPEQVEQS